MRHKKRLPPCRKNIAFSMLQVVRLPFFKEAILKIVNKQCQIVFPPLVEKLFVYIFTCTKSLYFPSLKLCVGSGILTAHYEILATCVPSRSETISKAFSVLSVSSKWKIFEATICFFLLVSKNVKQIVVKISFFVCTKMIYYLVIWGKGSIGRSIRRENSLI